ncbi:LamG domain-containing protein [Pseudomonas spirodelae]|uniref:LamG domain-containing protein n=1 Tax=Pseudomonas spirodelae TaxID=3101751 RepID=A0ABU5P7S8_9PSED|nr:LamG domain-containing protein [Pseudomonas sp. T5W1]MEA1605726.1 LamG domain-containing protein [Pseudomonas sp. T5W1]
MGSKPKAQTVGFRYSFDIHFGIAKAIDGILTIRASGKTAWTGNATTNQTISINAPDLFGGDKAEGGINGKLDLMLGDEDQPLNTQLADALGGLVPNFRGFAGGFFSGLVTSINPYPKKWELLRYRQLKGWDGAVWYPETCAINLAAGQVRAMNPAHILYEVYTNRENGLGIDRSMLDDAEFRAAALKLYNEGFGLCIGWKRSSGTLADFRDQVCEHIGAYCGPDRNTGLITLKLFRDDYNVEALPLFDENRGLLSIEDEEASSALIAPSQLFVEYTDPITGESRRARAVNQAIAQRQGGPSAETVNYPWLPTADLAGRVAQRDMRIKASNLRKYKVRLDRRAADIGPGDAFRIRSLKRGIEVLVVRAGKIEDGTLADGVITITALQDVFGLPATSFVAVPPSGYVPPDRTPTAPALRRLMEVPYRELAGLVDQANLALVDVTAAWLSTLAARPTGLSLSYTILTRPGGGSFIERGTGDWCPTALLVSAMSAEAGPTVAALASAIELDQVVIGQAALLDDEIVRVDAVNLTTNQVTLARGCVDTVPAQHSAGARIWFYDGFEAADETEYTSGVIVQARILTNTSQGQLAEGLAATDSLALAGRQGRPYSPGGFKINGYGYPTVITGPMTVSWAHRDRLMQADQLIDATQGSIGPEAGVTYSARVLRADNGAVLASYVGLTGTSQVVGAIYTGDVILELWSVRGAIASLQRHVHRFNYDNKEVVASLLHFDGVDGSTLINDASGRVWTRFGSAQIDTDQSKFGGASLLLDGNGDYLTTPHDNLLNPSGAFTIECWFRAESLPTSTPRYLARKGNAGEGYVSGWIIGNRIVSGQVFPFCQVGTGAGEVLLIGSSPVLVGNWVYLAATYDGTNLRLFVNGFLQGSSAAVPADNVSQVTIGQDPNAPGVRDWHGWVDEFRFTKGKALYTSSFTPPTAPFPNP